MNVIISESNVNLFCKADGTPIRFMVYADYQKQNKCISQIIHMLGGETVSGEGRQNADYVIVEPGTACLDGLDAFSEGKVVRSQFIWSSIAASRMLKTGKFCYTARSQASIFHVPRESEDILAIYKPQGDAQAKPSAIFETVHKNVNTSAVVSSHVLLGSTACIATPSSIGTPQLENEIPTDSSLQVDEQFQGTRVSNDILDPSINTECSEIETTVREGILDPVPNANIIHTKDAAAISAKSLSDEAGLIGFHKKNDVSKEGNVDTDSRVTSTDAETDTDAENPGGSDKAENVLYCRQNQFRTDQATGSGLNRRTDKNSWPSIPKNAALILEYIETNDRFENIHGNKMYMTLVKDVPQLKCSWSSIRNFVVKTLPKQIDKYCKTQAQKTKWTQALSRKRLGTKERMSNFSVAEGKFILDIIRKANAYDYIGSTIIFRAIAKLLPGRNADSIKQFLRKNVIPNYQLYGCTDDEYGRYDQAMAKIKVQGNPIFVPGTILENIRSYKAI